MAHGRGTKSLPAAQLEAARVFVKGIVDRDFDGNVSAMARHLKIGQSHISRLLSRSGGAGPKLLDAVARYSGVTIDTVIGRAPLGPAQPPLAARADWPAAREAAERDHPEIDARFFDQAGTLHLPLGAPDHLDGVFVAGLARELAALEARVTLRKARAG